METEIRDQLMKLLSGKLQRLAIRESDLGNGFDLVKSGLLNSLEFVDLLASMEKIFDFEIDFEEGLNTGELTTVGGITRAFMNKK
jgi:acyl carrier protein